MANILLDERIKTFLDKFYHPEIVEIQSLLFYGEEEVGKKTIALSFVRGLLCQNKNESFNGCDKCSSCVMFDKGLHPDYLFLEPIGNNIEIENVRRAIEFLYYKPQLSSWRILVINEADRLQPAAQNTLLKTIEEPPSHTLIILITAHPQKLLPTVLSRLMPLRFQRASFENLTNFLVTNYNLDWSKAQELAQLAHGKTGLAIKLIGQDYYQKIKKQQESFKKILNSDFTQQSKLLGILCQDKDQIISVLKNWLDLLNNEIIAADNTQIKLTRELLKAFYLISESNINSKLLLENIFLNYAH